MRRGVWRGGSLFPPLLPLLSPERLFKLDVSAMLLESFLDEILKGRRFECKTIGAGGPNQPIGIPALNLK
jgi:hypothetical protein